MLKDFFNSVPGMASMLLFKLFISSIFVCLGIHLFNFKKLIPFFSLKRVISVFFIFIALRVFYGALHFF